MIKHRTSISCLLLIGSLFAGRAVVAEESWLATADDDEFVIEDLLLDGDSDDFRFVQSQPSRRGRPPVASLVGPAIRRPRRAAPSGTTLLARVPGMFGDFFGGGRPVSGPDTGPKGAPPRGGAATRLVKISENYSPQPRNRVYATYHFFNDALDGSFGDVNRYAFGFEHLFWEDRWSFELRVPFAHTLASDQLDDPISSKDTEFGNMTMLVKKAIWSDERTLLSTGLGVSVPTADDVRLFRPGDRRLILEIENRAVHLLPFLGLIMTPSEQLFIQGFTQLDIDTTGNPARGDLMAMNLHPLGVVQDPTLLFLDLSVGYWMCEDSSRPWITGFAPIVELHYATTLNDADLIKRSGFLIGDLSRRYDILDFTFGMHVEFQEQFSLRPGIVIPLRTGDDRQFDYEVFLQANLTY
ncbi:MAG: hypothetical protein O3C40_14140 [Planctomycetota bacterium]|nr:hypothetical protein [Planctomycetota bacterium]